MSSFNDFSERTYMYMSSLGFRICVSTLTHPFEYAKFLIQIGHEPIPPVQIKTLFGKPATVLPGVFKYVSFIKNTDGILGCYRGFGPKITGQIISTLVAESITKKMNVNEAFDPEDEISSSERWSYFQQKLTKDVVSRTVTIVVSQPFYVISARMMAQFVGGENIYTGFFASVKEIYSNEGILGLFTGMIPRWLGEIIALVITRFAIYGVNNYLLEDKELKAFSSAVLQFGAQTITYPFNVVSACMAVNGRLAAGLPPQMPVFDNWTHCWRHLHQSSQLTRGSSIFFYRYCPPQIQKRY